MIVTTEEAKEWCRLDGEDDMTIKMLVGAAEEYLKNSTGIEFDKQNQLAKLYCLVLVSDWYENRELVGKAPGEKARFTIKTIAHQLRWCYVPSGGTTGSG